MLRVAALLPFHLLFRVLHLLFGVLHLLFGVLRLLFRVLHLLFGVFHLLFGVFQLLFLWSSICFLGSIICFLGSSVCFMGVYHLLFGGPSFAFWGLPFAFWGLSFAFSPFSLPPRPTPGEEFYEASPYEPITSRLSDIFRLASIFSGNPFRALPLLYPLTRAHILQLSFVAMRPAAVVGSMAPPALPTPPFTSPPCFGHLCAGRAGAEGQCLLSQPQRCCSEPLGALGNPNSTRVH